MNLLSDNTVRVGASDYAILPYVSNRPEVLWGMEVVKNNTPAGMSAWVQRMMQSINLYNHNGANLSQWPLWNAAPIDGTWARLGELGLKWRTEVGVMRWRADGWVALQSSSDGPSSTTRSLTSHLLPTAMSGLSGLACAHRRWMADDTADQDPKSCSRRVVVCGAASHDQRQVLALMIWR